MSNALAVRLASRYIDAASALSIARTGKLERFLLFAAGLCLVTVVGFVAMASREARIRHVVHDVDVAFELQCAPPEPSFRAMDMLVPLRFEEGAKPAPLATQAVDTVKKEGVVAQPSPPPTAQPAQLSTRPSQPEKAPIAMNNTVVGVTPVAVARPVKALLPNPLTGIAANAATPVAAEIAGGEADGVAGATGAGGTGAGPGQGDPNALAGGDFGITNGVSTRAPQVAMGNIGPYKRDLVARLRAAWHPEESYDSVTVDIALDHDGKVLDKKILVSSGSERLDGSLLHALDTVELAALPDWYRGQELHIKLVLRNT